MLSVKFSGNSIEVIAREAKQFADVVLATWSNATNATQESDSESAKASWAGYRPYGVGVSEFRPVDDGREWDKEAVKYWIGRLKDDGKEVVRILAQGKVIDPRAEARKLKWSGPSWAGVWTGPRRQAGYVKDEREFTSWPYGHTYEEPRKLWMHEDVANKVLSILSED